MVELRVTIKDAINDWCGLCPYPLSQHIVMTEQRREGDCLIVTPIGWRCPTNG
jgi:hypothetical protein